MSDYKYSLNLPHTRFPMKASLPQTEPTIIKRWESLALYDELRKKNRHKPTYTLHDGPPYANGPIHIGHAVNKILKDIVVKSKLMSGFDVSFVPGWDCHGLPIELNVEKKIGRVGPNLDAKSFRQTCRQYAQQQITIQLDEFKRLGVLADWKHPYKTMDFLFEANIIRALGEIIRNGHLQQGFKPVHWCIKCSSALAEAEVEYADKNSIAIDVRFKILEETHFLNRFTSTAEVEPEISIPIWTTTPWSLPANEAVALNPHLTYILIQTENERLLIAKPLLKNCLLRYGIMHYRCIGEVAGKALQGFLLKHPFYPRQVPLVLSEHVTVEMGTGAVHVAPAHGLDDYLVGKHYKLPLVNPVGNDGTFLPGTALFSGEHVFKVTPSILAQLKKSNTLLQEEIVKHSYPHCWRHKTPLIFRATPQWFISMDQYNLRKDSLAALRQVHWIPEWGETRINSMIKDRPDWCISRQRSWGVPIPLFVHRFSRELHPKSLLLLEQIALLVEVKGIEAWHDLNIQEVLGEEADDYEKLSDCLDVWFDSGVSHYAFLLKNLGLISPADLYLEGTDQYRGWFQSSLLTSIAIRGKPPYKTVLTHGFTVDEKGHKMSKSLGNVVAPTQIIKDLGADVLRLWISSTDYRKEISVSGEILKRTVEAYRRIRNTIRFLLANLHDFDPSTHKVDPSNMLSLDIWVVENTKILQQEIILAYQDFQFHSIYQKLQHYCINNLGGFYLDVIKDRQYTLQKESIARRSAQTALFYIAEAMVRWLAPILSFTADEIWSHLPGHREPAVFLSQWYSLSFSFDKDPLRHVYDRCDRQRFWSTLIQVRHEINKVIEKLRTVGDLGSSLEAEVELYVRKDSELSIVLGALQEELKFILITSAAKLSTTIPTDKTYLCKVNKEDIVIKVTPALGKKCVRCWHRCSDVGKNLKYKDICIRCIDNLPEGKGEQRHYA